jgi:hypothetical protein
MEEDDSSRREAEHQALQAIYGSESVQGEPTRGPWNVSLLHSCLLEVHMPPDYPSTTPPTPVLHAPSLSLEDSARLGAELLQMYEGAECVFQWAAHLNDQLELLLSAPATAASEPTSSNTEAAQKETPPGTANAGGGDSSDACGCAGFTFTPHTSRYGQRARHFDGSSVDDVNRVEVVHGPQYHPPKSGPSETFQVCVGRPVGVQPRCPD